MHRTFYVTQIVTRLVPSRPPCREHSQLCVVCEAGKCQGHSPARRSFCGSTEGPALRRSNHEASACLLHVSLCLSTNLGFCVSILKSTYT